ncbi:hypothetical protein VB735_15125 [Halotia wernerae UHCC 0503]|nr:hypothetical protein [Halotia wernerae UHCC 0503]
MPTKKNPITDPTGEKEAAKAAQETDKKARQRLKDRFSSESTTQLQQIAINRATDGNNQSQ